MVVVALSLTLVNVKSARAICVIVASPTVPVSGSSVGVFAKVDTSTVPCVCTDVVLAGLNELLTVTWNLTTHDLPAGSEPMTTSTGETTGSGTDGVSSLSLWP